MRFYIAIFCVLIILLFVLQIATKKQQYSNLRSSSVESFTVQQQDLLARISKLLQQPVIMRDVQHIKEILATYENVLFSLNMPISMQVVILDAPQNVIGLMGELHPDVGYYQSIINSPSELHYAQPYSKNSMPDYPMLNYGVGVTDVAGNVIGVVEIKIPKDSFEHLAYPNNIESIKMYILKLATIYIACGMIGMLGIVIFCHHQKNMKKELHLARKALEVHKSVKKDINYPTNFDLMKLLDDVYCSLFGQASSLGVTLLWPKETSPLYCYAYKQQIMQDITLVTENMLRQLGSKGTLKMQVDISEGLVVLNITDDGFYKKLDQQWGDLVNKIKHTHRMYAGNTVAYGINAVSKKNNVVSLAEYT